MPSACSDSARRRAHARWVLAVLAALLGPPQLHKPVEASPRMSWGRASFPVASFVAYTSPFGLRVHPVSGGLRPHAGLDIAAPLGSAVRNWWGGTLTATISDAGCGNGLLIQSGAYEHLYCHLAGRVDGDTYRSGAVLLRRGQRVRTGQTIGHVGLTGNTTGPHLHWGLRYRDRWLDPAAVLRAMAAERRLLQPTGRGAFNVGQTR
jgi:murein DD-endopeptidase MepM/ murein hydrolase activator NlpD